MVNLSGWAINELPKWIVFVSWKVQSNGAALSMNTSKGGGVLFCDCLAFFPLRERGWVSILHCSYTNSTSFNHQTGSST